MIQVICYSSFLSVPGRAGAFSRDFTTSLAPECRAFSRALKIEKLKAPLIPGPEGAVDTNDWRIIVKVSVCHVLDVRCTSISVGLASSFLFNLYLNHHGSRGKAAFFFSGRLDKKYWFHGNRSHPFTTYNVEPFCDFGATGTLWRRTFSP